jgi:hypothetical protein
MREASVTVTGKVRDLQQRSGTHWFTKSEEAIVSFRASVFDEAGNLSRLVPVEIRGSAIAGSLNENDDVEAFGRYRAGTLRAKWIKNLTDGSLLTAEGLPVWAKVVAGLFFALIAAFMLFVGYQLVSGG